MIDTRQVPTNDLGMNTQTQRHPDIFLLLSMLLFILLQPLLHHLRLGKLMLGALMFVPVTLVTVKFVEKKSRSWPLIALAAGAFVFAAASQIVPSPLLIGLQWVLLAAFCGVAAIGLFSHVMSATSVIVAHLNTAISIYLLLALQWFAIYSAIDTFMPGAIQCSSAGDRQTDLLYFSLATLTTLGYGDVLPIHGEVRILASLEAVTGVLYVAITVAVLVSSYRQSSSSNEKM